MIGTKQMTTSFIIRLVVIIFSSEARKNGPVPKENLFAISFTYPFLTAVAFFFCTAALALTTASVIYTLDGQK
jgi:Na+/H+ antiporter NhaC